jgi:hypothetical protein
MIINLKNQMFAHILNVCLFHFEEVKIVSRDVKLILTCCSQAELILA